MIVLDTRSEFDARLLGYDSSCDPVEDGEGLVVSAERATLKEPPEVTLEGPHGQVTLVGRSEIEQVIKALRQALGEEG